MNIASKSVYKIANPKVQKNKGQPWPLSFSCAATDKLKFLYEKCICEQEKDELIQSLRILMFITIEQLDYYMNVYFDAEFNYHIVEFIREIMSQSLFWSKIDTVQALINNHSSFMLHY